MATEEAGFHEEVPLLPSTNNNDDQQSETSTNTTQPDSDINIDDKDRVFDNNNTESKKPHYSLFVAICFSLNYSIGSGILGLPYEYYNAGFVLGSVLLIYLGLLTYITYTFVMDGIQRAQAITTLSQNFSITRHKLLLDPNYTKEALSGTSTQSLQANYSFNNNKYQLSELIGIKMIYHPCTLNIFPISNIFRHVRR